MKAEDRLMQELHVPMPKRVSPDGRNVAVRNLRTVNPKYDGPAEWRASNGAYLTDKQVADWTPIAPLPELFQLDIVKQANGDWMLRINGKLISGARAPELVLAEASYHAAEHAKRTGDQVLFEFIEEK